MKGFISYLQLSSWKGFVIALIPFFGYGIAYSYESGFLSYFSLPEYLIKISIESIIQISLVLIYLILISFNILTVSYPLFRSFKHGLIIQKLTKLLLVLPLLLFLPHLNYILVLAVIIVIILFSVWYLIKRLLAKFEQKYINKHDERKQKESEFTQSYTLHDTNLFNSLIDSKVAALVVIFALFFFISRLSNLIGLNDASNDNQFLTFESRNEKYAIIRQYADYYVALQLNNNKKDHNILIFNNPDVYIFHTEYLQNFQP